MLYYTLCKLLLLLYVQHDRLECFTERNNTLTINSNYEVMARVVFTWGARSICCY
ncbi:hypothetical protein PF005_g6430 [Phytophthora fragariae]|uniref:Uncharacterized protein n=1 Tax=Phytophthora fragariae TaxID=53985 RepID=A0A6A3UHC0_9STRA|nr:hypothetical protein PF003_g38192 [Phytophthora fragariae]KAE8943333.1 hypothetical protein PF009_g6951 [Phytophthora fragariae]KAE9019503.1 hypothetical protein PF011_g5806 [Phytophthora fragariae]KAE9124924.1 hypothetical protein PF007_g6544 [Phytophthora fragariae]KAE9125976.1 hypothetical protein PF010_g5425 [Phytophthora fragariae]